MMFSLVTGLPSTTSATDVSVRFVRRLRGYYTDVRLPAAVLEGLAAHRVLPPIRALLLTDGNGVSRFSRMKFLHMLGASDSAGPSACSLVSPAPVLPSGKSNTIGVLDHVFRSSIPSLQIPLSLQRFKCSIAAALAWLGARWIATPFLYDSFIRYFMPVYPGAIWTFPSQVRFWRVDGFVVPSPTLLSLSATSH